MKKYPAIYLLLTALLYIVADIQGQTKTITLLKENIRQSLSSAEKKAALFSLCELGYTLHPDTLVAYAKTAETLAAADTDNRSKIKALYYQSYALTNKGLIDSSLHVAERCLQMMEASAVNDGILTCNIYNQQGRCFMRKNQYKEAIEMGYKVIAGAEKNIDTLLQVKGKR